MQIAEPCLQSFWCWVGFVVVFQSPNCVHLFVTSWTTADQASLSFNYLLKFAQIHVHWIGDAIQPSHPLSPASPPAPIFPSIRVFSNKSALHIRWPSIGASALASGLISFRIDCFDLLVVWGTLKNILQDHSLKASILQHLTFFMVRLSHLYMTTGWGLAICLLNRFPDDIVNPGATF